MLESIFAMDADDSADELGDEGLMPVRLGVDKVPVDLLIVNGDDRSVVQRLQADNPGALLVLVGQPPGAEPAGTVNCTTLPSGSGTSTSAPSAASHGASGSSR